MNALGSYTVSYVQVDAAGNTGSVDRVVNVVDTTAPVVTLLGSGSVNVVQSGSYVEAGASWTDNVDGSGSIVVASTGSVDVFTPGSYTLVYFYTDSSSNVSSSVSRVVNVTAPDVTPPVVTLVGGTGTVYVEYASLYVEQ